ncbi:MAG: Sua5/YciO/YrdC/YwlC family protein [Planctomycetota bacterium]
MIPAEALEDAADLLRRGELVGFPTETVYGVAARADLPDAVRRLRERAGVGGGVPLTVHVPSAEVALGVLPETSASVRRLVRKAMPGPITLKVSSGRGEPVTVRCPDHPLTQRLLYAAGGPVVGASAVGPGGRAAVDAASAAQGLGAAVGGVLDGGRCRFGRPSTLVEVTRRVGRDESSRADLAEGHVDKTASGSTFAREGERAAQAEAEPVVGAGSAETAGSEKAGRDSRYDLEIRRRGVIDERMVQKMQNLNVLLVCTGNTCRSPMAAALAEAMFKGNPHVQIGSAGVYAEDGQRASAEAVTAMNEMGLDLSGHRSRRLSADLIQTSDLVFTMTASHREAVLAFAPQAAEKVERLDASADITDPIGGDLRVYRQTADQIRRALESRLKEQL